MLRTRDRVYDLDLFLTLIMWNELWNQVSGDFNLKTRIEVSRQTRVHVTSVFSDAVNKRDRSWAIAYESPEI